MTQEELRKALLYCDRELLLFDKAPAPLNDAQQDDYQSLLTLKALVIKKISE